MPLYHLLDKGFGHQFDWQDNRWGAISGNLGLSFSPGWPQHILQYSNGDWGQRRGDYLRFCRRLVGDFVRHSLQVDVRPDR